MSNYIIVSIIMLLVTIFSYINHRYLQWQNTIAVMAAASLTSIIILLLEQGPINGIAVYWQHTLQKIDFHSILMNGMLSFLLFAGSLFIDISTLKAKSVEIAVLSLLSTAVSTFLVGFTLYYSQPLLHSHIPLLYCLLFGALISPTDPIAVLATFKRLKVKKSIRIVVTGESIFNDGVAIVIFLTLYQLTFNNVPVTWVNVSRLFLQEAIGGLLFGGLIGLIANHLLKKSNAGVAILITLTIVTSAYTLANYLGLSGPLAMAVAGIMVGNQLKQHHNKNMSKILLDVWQIIEDILNTILFLLIGLEVISIHTNLSQLYFTLAAILVVLVVRFITVAIPIKITSLWRKQESHLIAILTWGGLRGALAVALALTLPNNPYRDLILCLTFGIVCFSIVVQGLSIAPLARKVQE
jgi:monovalent cation:H+ antiporter, CPA1 family